MKSLRALRTLIHISTNPQKNPQYTSLFISRFYSAQPQEEDTSSSSRSFYGDSVFDSTDYELPNITVSNSKTLKEQKQHQKPTWNEEYRDKADRKVCGEEEWQRRRAALLSKKLLDAALTSVDDHGDEVEEEKSEVVHVKEEDQKSLSVGIIGAPNAGKSSLANFMVGTKVAAVSRKTNTTTHEILGVMTKENTQICFFDTPGLMLTQGEYPHKDMKVRVESAWSSVGLYDALIVIFDVERHLYRPDSRVIWLIKHMGAEFNSKQKRILCMNKVDLVEKKKDLLKVVKEFEDLPGYERYFMISGLKGSGVKDLTQYLMEQAVKRPWDEDPLNMSEELMKTISLEVVRERILDHIHQEVPYGIEHRLAKWKDLRDGSLRIEQHIITPKESQRKILIGKKGFRIGRIGMEANEELRSIFKRDVHLILQVRVER